jgi:hypothetical protein
MENLSGRTSGKATAKDRAGLRDLERIVARLEGRLGLGSTARQGSAKSAPAFVPPASGKRSLCLPSLPAGRPSGGEKLAKWEIKAPLFSDQLRLLTGRKPCFDHAISMPNQSVGSNDYPLGTAPQPWDAPDPLPVMRREMKLLLIEISKLREEVERLRAAERETRHLSASLNQTIESRDEWRREAERLRALLAQSSGRAREWW